MTTASTLDIGAVSTAPGNFGVSRSAPSGTKGFRDVSFTGTIDRLVADTLDELVANPAARQSIGGASGVLAYVVAGSTMLPTYTGYYLLQSFASSPDGIDPDWPYVAFTLQAVLIGALT